MSITLQLSGYDKNTNLLAVEYPVPPREADYVKRVAAVDPADTQVLGAYPLSETQVVSIAGAIDTPVNPKQYRYFLEGYENKD
jgi:hypothetical protein